MSEASSVWVSRSAWKVEVMSANDNEIGGYKEIVLHVSGEQVYGTLRFESGGHRVQRVPATETQGRIHTSACTVAVMPEPDEAQAITLNPADLRIDTFRASGAGLLRREAVAADARSYALFLTDAGHALYQQADDFGTRQVGKVLEQLDDPPFGMTTAIDLKTRKIAWQRSMGTVKELGPLGIRTGLPIPLGMPTLGGPVATAAGLVFFNGTADYYLRALDVKTGKEVWKSPLPVGAQSTPLVYTSPETGRQFVVVTAGGGRTAPDRGDYIIAYALPEQAR